MDNQVREWLLRRAQSSIPFEACGFILNDNEVMEIRNVSDRPSKFFSMDPAMLIEKISDRIEEITAIWHTHPAGTTTPSATDLDAIKRGAVHRNWRYLIVTVDGIHEYETKVYAPPAHAFWNKFAGVSD